jgi:hypothetical protein
LVKFTSRLIYLRETRRYVFNRGLVDPTAGIEIMEKRKSLASAGIRTPNDPALA